MLTIEQILNPVDAQGVAYDQRHGGAFDRGSADSYYHRPRCPHLYEEETYTSPRINLENMTEKQIQDYHAGYDWNERFGDKKNWD